MRLTGLLSTAKHLSTKNLGNYGRTVQSVVQVERQEGSPIWAKHPKIHLGVRDPWNTIADDGQHCALVPGCTVPGERATLQKPAETNAGEIICSEQNKEFSSRPRDYVKYLSYLNDITR